MAVVLQVDFPSPGPWGHDSVPLLQSLAESIASEPGLRWKIWTENPRTGEAGGVYLFEDIASAEAYLKMHTARLEGMGLSGINAKLFEVNEALSAIDRAPLG